ncbi:Major Facilitator Superfamily protein [Pseudohyphozyma bogoriensis]|nr:Major Facilitator Superfamily protein [Pseudohyphozyma bogoriensis]
MEVSPVAPVAPKPLPEDREGRKEIPEGEGTELGPEGGSRSEQGTVVDGGEVTGDMEKSKEVIWVEWEENDPEDPYNFTARKKWTITCVCCLLTAITALTSTSFPMGNASMEADLHTSREMAALGLSGFPLGFAIAPMVLAPLAEELGRYTMYAISTFIYLIFFIPTALAENIATVIVSRIICGLAASCGSTIVGGTLADLFRASDRGPAMALFGLSTFSGTGLGPVMMGYVAQNLGWRYIQYIQTTNANTRSSGPVILKRRAAKLRKTTGDSRYQCRDAVARAGIVAVLKVSLGRPLQLLFTEPIVASISLWIGFCWGVLYLTLEAVSLVMEEVYGFNIGQCGLVFFSVIVGASIGHVTNRYQEKLYQKRVAKQGPEARLYAALVGAVLFPSGLFIFAFSQGRGHWMGPICGLVIIFASIFTIYVGVFNYLADVYTLYASSALSGQSLSRNVAGFAFPLFTFQMYDRLGFQWASFLSGCLGLALAPVPYILMAYGPRIRAASKFARGLEKIELKEEDAGSDTV